MRRHINDLATWGINISGVEVPKPSRILDIRVQPGGVNSAKVLEAFAEDAGITIRIAEFGG